MRATMAAMVLGCLISSGAMASETLFFEHFRHSTFDPRWSVLETGDQSMRWFLVDSTFAADNPGGGNNQTVLAFFQLDTTGYQDIAVTAMHRRSNIASDFEPQDFIRLVGYESVSPGVGGTGTIELSTEGQWGGSNQPPRDHFEPLSAEFGAYADDNASLWIGMEFNTSQETERLFIDSLEVTGIPIPDPGIVSFQESFEDGLAGFDSRWTQLNHNGNHGIVDDPIRPGNTVFAANGTETSHHGFSTTLTGTTQGFSLSFEFLAFSTDYGPLIWLQSDANAVGIRLTEGLSWLVMDTDDQSAVSSSDWGASDPVGAGDFPFPTGQWVDITLSHDAANGIFRSSISLDDGPVLYQREISPTIWNTLSAGFTEIVLGIEETSTQYIDNIQIATILCPADLTGDSIVDSGDLALFITLFLTNEPQADLTGDGVIDSGDLADFIFHFLDGC